MDISAFQAFVKHAMEDESTPSDYYATRAAVLEKLAISREFAMAPVQAQLNNGQAGLERLGQSVNRLERTGSNRAKLLQNYIKGEARKSLAGTREFSATRAGNPNRMVSGMIQNSTRLAPAKPSLLQRGMQHIRNLAGGPVLRPAMAKLAWSWGGFKEGVRDEGVPLAGATIGAGLGGLRGAALGYAAGGLASIAHSKMKGEKPSLGRKLLAASALGYGAGGLAHGGLARLTKTMKPTSRLRGLFHEAPHAVPSRFNKAQLMEEALPAAGATLATGATMATNQDRQR